MGTPRSRSWIDAFSPNRSVSTAVLQGITVAWAVVWFGMWFILPSAIIPAPVEVLSAFGTVWAEGLPGELWVSFEVNLEAILLTLGLSLVCSYLTVVPAMRPLAGLVSRGRFLGLAGLTFLFTLSLGGGHALKVALLVFGMTVFFVTSMVREVASIPREKFDHARTLRMGEWRVVWEVIVLGKADVAIEMLRQNAAMAWMMLPMIEGLVRSEGGVGAMLLAQSKHFHLAEVFAIQAAILGVGLLQDAGLGLLRHTVCPWADLALERR